MTQRIGQKHIISCICVLNQLKQFSDAPNFSFIVFSIIENNNIIQKYAECPNCKAVHKIIEIGKSEIVYDFDKKLLLTKDDYRENLPEKLTNILDEYNCEQFIYEETYFILSEKQWGKFVQLTEQSMRIENNIPIYEGKKLVIKNQFDFQIDYWKSQLT